MTSQEHLIHYLETQFKVIDSLMPRVLRHPGGSSVHKLRVAARRARAAFWVLRHSSSPIYFKKLENQLRKLVKALGHVRELDVAILDANNYDINSKKIKLERKIAQEKLRKLINQDQRRNISQQFSEAKKKISIASPTSFSEAEDRLRMRLNHLLLQHVHGQKGLHQLRIAMKKVRYVLEAMGKAVGPMKGLQNILGDSNDLEFLQGFVGRNKQLKTEQHKLNDKAIILAGPTIRFAVRQLEQGV
jgi:CHAD domain-containing protein